MRPRHALPATLPRLWLMTDERQGAALWPAIRALPRGAGIVFRHLHTPPTERQALLMAVQRAVRARGLVLLVSGRDHGPPLRGRVAVSVHDMAELGAARRAGARLIFVSPVFDTRTHPGTRNLGRLRFAALAARAHAPVIALGGMTAARFAHLRRLGADGWAAIDGLTASPGRQKRKAVPR